MLEIKTRTEITNQGFKNPFDKRWISVESIKEYFTFKEDTTDLMMAGERLIMFLNEIKKSKR